MSIDLNESLQALRKWQKDESRVQLHPGDIGWYTRNGQKATTNAIRNWFLKKGRRHQSQVRRGSSCR